MVRVQYPRMPFPSLGIIVIASAIIVLGRMTFMNDSAILAISRFGTLSDVFWRLFHSCWFWKCLRIQGMAFNGFQLYSIVVFQHIVLYTFDVVAFFFSQSHSDMQNTTGPPWLQLLAHLDFGQVSLGDLAVSVGE